MINEFSFLRVVACVSIVFLHTTTQYERLLGAPDEPLWFYIRMLLCAATPAFILLSEIILANRYHNRIPDGFFTKRMTYIVIPFVSFAIIDAYVSLVFYPHLNVPLKIQQNLLLGQFTGWFILIILQFYLLHYLVVKLKVSLKWFVPVSIVVMFGYLYGIKEYSGIITSFIRYPHMIFPAWIGYFAVAFAIGRHYEKWMTFVSRYWWAFVVLAAGSAAWIWSNYSGGYTVVNSRRIDLPLFTFSVSMLILWIGRSITRYRLLHFTGAHAFAIYLLHFHLLRFTVPFVSEQIDNPYAIILVSFGFTMVACIVLAQCLTRIPFGQAIVGKVPVKNVPIPAFLTERWQMTSKNRSS